MKRELNHVDVPSLLPHCLLSAGNVTLYYYNTVYITTSFKIYMVVARREVAV